MNVPQLRFDGFDKPWKEIKLGELVEFKNGLNYLKSDRGETVYTVGVKNFNQKKLRSSLELEMVNLGSIPNKDFLLKKNDLLFVRSNGNKELVGRMMMIETELANTYYSGFVIRGRIKEQSPLEPPFLLSLEGKIKGAMKTLTGGTNISNLSQSILNSLILNVPSIEEQKKIATFIALIEQKIEKQQEKIEKLEQFKKGMMQKIFSQELRFKDKEGGEFSEWEEKLLNQISVINPKTEPLEEEFYYIDLESVDKGRVEELKIVNNEDAPSRAQRVLMQNDVLFQTVRPYQQNHFYVEELSDKQLVASTGFAQIRTNQSSRYIYYLMHTEEFSQEVLNRCTGTSYPAINSSHLGKINVSVPSLAEQEKIAIFLFTLDKKLSREKEKLMVLEEQKRGFMQGMFL